MSLNLGHLPEIGNFRSQQVLWLSATRLVSFPPSADPTPMPETSPSWFDGHLDLACMALEGRDLRSPLAKAAGPPQPPSITLPSLREGAVSHFLATLYTGLGTTGPCGYATVEDDAALNSALAQRRLYARLADAGDLRLARTRGEAERGREYGRCCPYQQLARQHCWGWQSGNIQSDGSRRRHLHVEQRGPPRARLSGQ